MFGQFVFSKILISDIFDVLLLKWDNGYVESLLCQSWVTVTVDGGNIQRSTVMHQQMP